MMGWNNKFIVL